MIRFGKQEGANVVDRLVGGGGGRSGQNAPTSTPDPKTLFTSGAFKGSALARRCLVIATGWYPWRAIDGKRKQPYYIHHRRPLAFAGIWTARKLRDYWEKSFAIVTAPANEVLARVHNRMPLVLHPRAYADWLSPTTADPCADAAFKQWRHSSVPSLYVRQRPGKRFAGMHRTKQVSVT